MATILQQAIAQAITNNVMHTKQSVSCLGIVAFKPHGETLIGWADSLLSKHVDSGKSRLLRLNTSEDYSLRYMKKIKKVWKGVLRGRLFREWVKQIFGHWSRHQNWYGQGEFEEILEKLRDIEDSIEIVARQIAQWAKMTDG